MMVQVDAARQTIDARSGDAMRPRVAMVAGSARTLLGPRAGLMRLFGDNGWDVLGVAPGFTAEQESALAVHRVAPATFALEPKGPAMFSDRRVRGELAALLRAWKPDIMIAMSERIMALAVMAAAKARVPRRIALVNGLRPRGMPYDAVDDPMRASPKLLSRAMQRANVAIFHNRDDRRTLERAGALPSGLDVHVLPGSGVDLVAFPAQPMPSATDDLVFLMIATLDQSRGVLEYCEAAARLKLRAPRATFLLAGPAGEGASGLKPEVLRRYAITYLGAVSDVRPLLAQCHVFVYPSHGEGRPGSMMEALASGRPSITTDAPGCRDLIDDCVSGMLVAPRDAVALERAMESLLRRPDQLASMSRAARLKAERCFDQRQVLDAWRRIVGITA